MCKVICVCIYIYSLYCVRYDGHRDIEAFLLYDTCVRVYNSDEYINWMAKS